MKAVILAGGLGTRISEETIIKPKPMIEIGGKPILWHIMKMYSHYGINDFIVCCGYKGYFIKEYFANYNLHTSDLTFDVSNNTKQVHQNHSEPWKVTLVDTGETSQTGGRLKRVKSYLEGEESFCMTYGDGLSSVNIKEVIDFHHNQKCLATLTAALPPGRFGAVEISKDNKVSSFREKPRGEDSYVNGGFFVLSPKVIDLIDSDSTIWERGPMEKLALDGNLSAYRFDGFWQPMDTLRDKFLLEDLWSKERAPWRIWND
jgi:glucose-1-phosphate cytidylyltransferase